MFINSTQEIKHVAAVRLKQPTEMRETEKARLYVCDVLVWQDDVTSDPETQEMEIWFPLSCLDTDNDIPGDTIIANRQFVIEKEKEIAEELKAKRVGISAYTGVVYKKVNPNRRRAYR